MLYFVVTMVRHSSHGSSAIVKSQSARFEWYTTRLGVLHLLNVHLEQSCCSFLWGVSHDDLLALGSLPPTIGSMSSLTGAALISNSLIGSIPFPVAYLLNLNTLNLSRNKLAGEKDNLMLIFLHKFPPTLFLLSGSIPSVLFSATSLTSLSLAKNSFTGNNGRVLLPLYFFVQMCWCDVSCMHRPDSIVNCPIGEAVFIIAKWK